MRRNALRHASLEPSWISDTRGVSERSHAEPARSGR